MNFKRGDIETAHARASRDFDVHIGSGASSSATSKDRRFSAAILVGGWSSGRPPAALRGAIAAIPPGAEPSARTVAA
jgi:hypothetical protein